MKIHPRKDTHDYVCIDFDARHHRECAASAYPYNTRANPVGLLHTRADDAIKFRMQFFATPKTARFSRTQPT